MARTIGRCALATLTAGVLAGILSATAVAAAKGQPDRSFGAGGIATVHGARLVATAVQRDGKVVAVGDNAGTPIRLLVVRLNKNGSVDKGFNHGRPVLGPAGTVAAAVVIQPDGKLVVAGSFGDGTTSSGILVERFSPTGSLDQRFGSHGTASALPRQARGLANAVALASGGKIVVGGSSTGANGFPRTTFARFDSAGRLDRRFGVGGIALVDLGRYSVANGIAVQRDGRIVFGGSERNDLRTMVFLAGRLRVDGRLDGSALVRQFGSGSAAYGVALQPDGKAVFGGFAGDLSRGSTALIVRLTTAGGVDHGFGADGAVKLVAADSGNQCCGEDRSPGASAVSVVGSEIVAAGFYDTFGRARHAVWGLAQRGAVDSGFGSQGRLLAPLTGASSEARGLAVAPGGGLVITGFATAPFSSITSFVERIGGPPTGGRR